MDNPAEYTSSLLEIQEADAKKMSSSKDACILFRKRYLVVVFIIISWIIMVMMRTNLSICLVEMTSNKTFEENNVTYVRRPEFEWTSIEKGLLLSSFSWGLFFSPAGGLLATRFGGVKAFGLGIMGTALLTVVTPFLIKKHFILYLAGRFLEGICEGISAASEAIIYVFWAPSSERTLMSNSSYFGFSMGIVFTYPLAAWLTSLFNWECTFYITGGIAFLWAVVWLLMIRESPANDKCMLKAEKNYFERLNMPLSKKKIVYPWKEILSSKPLWALWNEHFVEAWSLSFFSVCLPLYLNDVFEVNIQEIGWFSSIPFYFEFIARFPGAILADYLKTEKRLNPTTVHKFYIGFSQISSLVFLILTTMTNDYLMNFVTITLSRSCYSLASISYSVLPIDVGGRYCGFIMGVTFTTKCIGYILNPIVIGLMVTNHSAAEWNRYFIFLSAFNVWALIIFAIYGSGELQKWAAQAEINSTEPLESK